MPTYAYIERWFYLESAIPIHAYLCLYWTLLIPLKDRSNPCLSVPILSLFIPGKDQPNPCLPMPILSAYSTWKGPAQSMPTCAYIEPCLYLERASPIHAYLCLYWALFLPGKGQPTVLSRARGLSALRAHDVTRLARSSAGQPFR